MHLATQHSDDLRREILSAAELRFGQYGYNKTTMAEIARDCNMSAANLYRYFENKLDIGANLACRCLDDKIQTLQSVIDDAKQTAADRLRRFTIVSAQHTYKQWSDRPRINEMVMAICNERMSIVDQHMQKKHTLIVSLLKQATAQGEFAVTDPEATADAILTACTLFNVPLLMPMFSLETLERKASRLVDLLLKGLVKR